ncbi:MAG TPA: RHS repeat-associated core domain-containing protein, partial [Kofleriaceae bacterium]
MSNTYAAGQQPSAWTSFAYDVLGRVTSTTAPDNTQRQTSYLVGQTVGLDQQGHPKTAFTDGYGRVIRIDEQNFGTTGTTHYTYDAEGRLIAVTDALGHPTTVEYDMLGRKTATVDPDRGRIETTFLANGLVHESHDASGQVIRFDYDGIGRQILREDLDASNRVTRTATWQWDTDPSGTPSGASRGRLVSTTDSQVSTTITTANVYDADGHVTETQRCIDATCASTRASFDKAGRLASVTYPDAAGGFGGNAETVPYSYDDAGELRSVGTYLRDADYEIDGAPAHLRYGNEVTTTLSYDPMRRWVNTITAAGSRGTLFDAAYSYDAVGRIHVAIETNPKTTQLGYTYDDLGRLVRVDGSNTARKENFAYDVIGRMKSSGATGDLHYDDPLHVHAPTGADIGYARNYDTNGNTTTIRNPSGRRLGLTWNVDNTLASITDGNVTSQLAYDTDGTRVKRVTAAGTSLYFGPLVEIVNGRQLRYYYAGERLIARRDAGDVMYYTRDLAHSTRVVSDPNGKAADRYEYSAFGGVYSRSESVPQDQEQGGGRHDDDSDLTYMRARYYDPGLMHFLSADTIVPNVHDPRSFHRYAYTQQDPINFWDPSGHMPMRVSWRKDAIAHSSFAWMAAQGGFA